MLLSAPTCPASPRRLGAFMPVHAIRTEHDWGIGTYARPRACWGSGSRSAASTCWARCRSIRLPGCAIGGSQSLPPGEPARLQRGLRRPGGAPGVLVLSRCAHDAGPPPKGASPRSGRRRSCRTRTWLRCSARCSNRWPAARSKVAFRSARRASRPSPERTRNSRTTQSSEHGGNEREHESSAPDPSVTAYYLYGQWAAQEQLAAATRSCPHYADLPGRLASAWVRPGLVARLLRAGRPRWRTARPVLSLGSGLGLPPSASRAHSRGRVPLRVCRAGPRLPPCRVRPHRPRHGPAAVVHDPRRGGRGSLRLVRGRGTARAGGARSPATRHGGGRRGPRARCPRTSGHGWRGTGILRTWVFEFETTETCPLPDPPALALAALDTHDLPRFAAYLWGDDVSEREELGVITAAEAVAEQALRAVWRERLLHRLGLAEEQDVAATTAAALEGCLVHLARQPGGHHGGRPRRPLGRARTTERAGHGAGGVQLAASERPHARGSPRGRPGFRSAQDAGRRPGLVTTLRPNPPHALGEVDLHLFNEGSHRSLGRKMGAHPLPDGGATFSVWAPNATGVSVIGDFNSWDAGARTVSRCGVDRASGRA